jgi:hypothetical protein
MSVSGLSSSSFFDFNTQSIQNQMRQFRREFQQLGQDLASGNLSAAQSDFATLQQLGPQSNASSASQTNPIAQAFNQLATDLQSGNLTAAQQDFSTLAQDVQNRAVHGHHRHHHASGDGSSISQAFSQLGQALQSGNLSAAQQAYTNLQQDFEQFAQNPGLQPTQGSSSSSANGLSVTV